MLVVGDSLVVADRLRLCMRQSEAIPPSRSRSITKVSSGLVRPDFYDWPKVLAEAVAEFHPQRDRDALRRQREAEHAVRRASRCEPFSDEWKAEYYRRVGEAIEHHHRGGAEVVWMGLPIMRSEQVLGDRPHVQLPCTAAVCEQHPGATYIDGYALFADDQGQYSAYLIDFAGQRRLMREDDGIHFTNAGGDRAAEAVMEALLGVVPAGAVSDAGRSSGGLAAYARHRRGVPSGGMLDFRLGGCWPRGQQASGAVLEKANQGDRRSTLRPSSARLSSHGSSRVPGGGSSGPHGEGRGRRGRHRS